MGRGHVGHMTNMLLALYGFCLHLGLCLEVRGRGCKGRRHRCRLGRGAQRGHHVALEVDHQRGTWEGPVAKGRGPVATTTTTWGLLFPEYVTERLGDSRRWGGFKL